MRRLLVKISVVRLARMRSRSASTNGRQKSSLRCGPGTKPGTLVTGWGRESVARAAPMRLPHPQVAEALAAADAARGLLRHAALVGSGAGSSTVIS